MDQAVVLRKLSGEARLLQALSLSDFVRFLAKRAARKKSNQRTFIDLAGTFVPKKNNGANVLKAREYMEKHYERI